MRTKMHPSSLPWYILVLLTFMDLTNCYSQIISDTANLRWYTTIYVGEPTSASTEIIEIGEPVTLNDTSYYHVLRALNGNQNPFNEYGYIREDSGKVFYRRAESHNEFMLYDFTTDIGDTIVVYGIQDKLPGGIQECHYILDSITSQEFYGIERKVYHFQAKEFVDWHPYTGVWIEGIGSTSGLLHNQNMLTGVDGFDLRCVFQNDQPLYKRIPDEDCIYVLYPYGIEKTNSLSTCIYPNPTNTLLTIETDFSDRYNIEITSLNGQLIYSKQMEGTTLQLDLSSFQRGVYFITIRSKDFVTTRKIVKL